MREFEITTLVKEYSFEELPKADRLLVEEARGATRSSLATYSRFHVGAAILMENGDIVKGFQPGERGLSVRLTCAERTAAFFASASHPAWR